MFKYRKFINVIILVSVSICTLTLLLIIVARGVLRHYLLEHHANLPFEPCTPHPPPVCTPTSDNSLIAFSSNRACSNWLTRELVTSSYDIYVMNADGTCPVRLTHTLINALNPSWSPDGTCILFVSETMIGLIGDHDSRSYAVYVMDTEGSRARRLADSGRCHPSALWSPDGSRIVFLSEDDNENCILHTMNKDGSHRAPLVGIPMNSARARLGWSPDGKRIAFSATDPKTGKTDVYIVNRSGNDLTNLTSHSAHDDFVAWTPDGRRLLFLSDQNRDEEENGIHRITTLYIMDADGTNVQRLLDDVDCGGRTKDKAYRGVWLPNSSSKIVVRMKQDWPSFPEWHVVDIDCVLHNSTTSGDLPPDCHTKKLPWDISFANSANWPPGGKQFSYEATDTRTHWSDIFVVNFDGTGLRNLTDCPADDISPDWSP